MLSPIDLEKKLRTTTIQVYTDQGKSIHVQMSSPNIYIVKKEDKEVYRNPTLDFAVQYFNRL